MRFPVFFATFLVVGATILAAGCESGPAGHQPMDPPAGPEARLPNWCRFHNGNPCLTWVEPQDSGHAMKLAWLEDGTWTESITVASGEDWFVNWADFPAAIELPSGDLVAHWLERSGPGTYHYDIRFSRSRDRGQSWADPLTPHLDETRSEHGFVSLYPADGDRAGLVWLDGRHTAGNDHGDHHGGGGEPMTLRTATVTGDGNLEAKQELDGKVCDCCQTSVAQTSNGLVAVYRGREADETRDIKFIRKHQQDTWSEPETLNDDGWVIPGCPVNGPAVTALDNRVAATWFTGAEPAPRVQLAFSDDGGRQFSSPVEIAGDRALGHVDVVMPDSDRLVTSWMETGEGGQAELFVQEFSLPDLAPGPIRHIDTPGDRRSAGFPRLVAAHERVFIAWTRVGDEGHSIATSELDFR